MGTLIKIALFLIALVIGVQLLLGAIGNAVGRNANVRGNWQTSTDLGAPAAAVNRFEGGQSLEFLPEPVRDAFWRARRMTLDAWNTAVARTRRAIASWKASRPS